MIYFNENVDEEKKKIFENLFLEALKVENQSYDNLTINLSFVSKQEIQKVNKEFRNVDKFTDVLSFPLIENSENKQINKETFPYDVDLDSGEICLGDILICREVALEQAREYGHSYDREVCYLLVHGIFHLLGYDHMQDDEKEVMRSREEEVLQRFNIKKDEEWVLSAVQLE